MKPKGIVAAAAAYIALCGAVSAEELKRTEIERHDLTGTSMEVILSIVDVPVGATIPRHFHYGEEAYYILEGASIQFPGKPVQTLATGKGGINVRDAPHAGYTIVGDKPLKILSVHVVDKGKELYPAAK